MKRCRICGGPVPPSSRGTTCSRGCAQKMAGARRRQALIENVEWLLGSGLAPVRVAQRIGKQPETIARTLYRAGRPDLARPLWLVLDQECPDCGAPCSRRAERCQPCAVRHALRERHAG